jgi:hypothetical protein
VKQTPAVSSAPPAEGEIPSCENCPYFHPVESDAGECRRKQPAIVFLPTGRKVQAIAASDKMELEMSAQSGFPPTRSDAWCGEHPAIQLSAYVELLETALPDILATVQNAVSGAELSGFKPRGKPS